MTKISFLTMFSLGLVFIIIAVCLASDDNDADCPNILLAKIHACEDACLIYEDRDDDTYKICLWNGLKNEAIILSIAADSCDTPSPHFNKDCFNSVRRKIFFKCSLRKKISENSTCQADLNV